MIFVGGKYVTILSLVDNEEARVHVMEFFLVANKNLGPDSI